MTATLQHAARAWKALVAFFAPGLVLVLEQLLTDGGLNSETLLRSLVAGAVTSLLVYLKRNAPSSDPTTSTPGPGL